MNTTKTNNLSFYNDQGIIAINAKQFDTGRKFIFNIIDNDEPFDLTDCKASLRILKADNTQFQGDICCIIDDRKIIIDTSIGNGNQILSAAGINTCELHLDDSNGTTLTTWNFLINVEKRVHDASHIVSTDSYDLLEKMILEEQNRVENMTKILKELKEKIPDTIITVNEDNGELEYISNTFDFEINDDGDLEYSIKQEE